jgi:putative heme iron utilization protein
MSETSADTARRLLRGIDRASLATSLEGRPYGSLVLVATAPDGAPLLLISALAQHTMNLKAEPRCALLLDGTGGLDEPLTGPRLTLLGSAVPTADPALRARFLARHPGAAFYAGFADFAFYQVAVERGHLVAGFGRIHWIEAPALLVPASAALAEAEPSLLAALNGETGLAAAIARSLGEAEGEWRFTGFDAEGADLRAGGRVARLAFAAPQVTPEGVEAELRRLAAGGSGQPS